MSDHTQPRKKAAFLVGKILFGLNAIRPGSEIAIRRRAARQLAHLPEYLKRDIGLIDD